MDYAENDTNYMHAKIVEQEDHHEVKNITIG